MSASQRSAKRSSRIRLRISLRIIGWLGGGLRYKGYDAGVAEQADARLSKSRSHWEYRFDADHPHQSAHFHPTKMSIGFLTMLRIWYAPKKPMREL